jgi:uncharacterized protein
MPDPLVRTSQATVVATQNASRYLQQLCKHWSHNLHVEFTPEHGRVVFPHDARGANFPDNAVAIFEALPEGLRILLDASLPEQLEALKGAIERHLDRFAFREVPIAYDWS